MPEIYTVSQLCRESRLLLERHYLNLMIEGEISNLARPASGHLYFSLKDSQSQVQCALFKPQLRRLRFRPDNGQQVIMRVRVSLYEPRGNFQLIVEHMEEAGDGALQRAYEQLKLRLSGEGLFDQGRKQALPTLPKQIGVISSSSGAVIHDIMTVLKRRFAAIPVLLFPVSVQGAEAVGDITKALQIAQSRNDCDVLILARGGGSLEDLQAFNEESVARAIADCPIPLISAVGHESDVTIADLAADQRAATPSAAAELASPDGAAMKHRIGDYAQRLQHAIQHRLSQRQQGLDWALRHLQQQHPGARLAQHQQTLNRLRERLFRNQNEQLNHCRAQLENISHRLRANNPAKTITQTQERTRHYRQRLLNAVQAQLQLKRQTFFRYSEQLDMVSPLATLKRGYSITESVDHQEILRDSQQVSAGDRIMTRLATGQLISTIESIQHDT